MMTGASLQLGARLSEAKQLFFDAPRVQSAVDQGTRKVLSKFGAFVRTRAKSSIRRRKGPSKPGQPPSSHTGLLKQHIYFVYEESQRSVVIGPVLLNETKSNAGFTTPQILEHAGDIRLSRDRYVRVHTSRDARGRFQKDKRVKVKAGTVLHYAARPYMGPAFEKEKPGLDSLWANSIQ